MKTCTDQVPENRQEEVETASINDTFRECHKGGPGGGVDDGDGVKAYF